METQQPFYLDTPVFRLFEDGVIDRSVLRACEAAKPSMKTAGDILHWRQLHGSFADVPGCRRPGRIPDTLNGIADTVVASNTPLEQHRVTKSRVHATHLSNEADFDFLTETQRNDALDFKDHYGHLPMFRILRCFLNRDGASRNDTIMAYMLGITDRDNERGHSLAEISRQVDLSRERVRQISQSYVLPETLMHPRLWTQYADHSTYYADAGHHAYLHVTTHEIPGLTFPAYAMVLHRTTMLENVGDRFLARRGWVKEISAWVRRLSRLRDMPRTIDSRISLDGLAMGGTLDNRISLIVLHQIAPAMGITTDAPDAIILHKNR